MSIRRPSGLTSEQRSTQPAPPDPEPPMSPEQAQRIAALIRPHLSVQKQQARAT